MREREGKEEEREREGEGGREGGEEREGGRERERERERDDGEACKSTNGTEPYLIYNVIIL